MKKQKSGFTLIELLVTSTIIIVLATIGFVSYTSAVQGSRDGKRKADMATVQQALVLYKQEHTTYPLGSGVASFPTLMNTLDSGDHISQPYPSDPKTTSTQYSYRSNGTTFCVCALVENTTKGNASNNSANTCAFGTGSQPYYCLGNP